MGQRREVHHDAGGIDVGDRIGQGEIGQRHHQQRQERQGGVRHDLLVALG